MFERVLVADSLAASDRIGWAFQRGRRWRSYLARSAVRAARLAKGCITHVEVLEYSELELGMEAASKIDGFDFPAFIVVDDRGNDLFAGITRGPVALNRS